MSVIQYRRAKATDNFEQISGLIYDTDIYIYPFWFGDKETAVKELSKHLGEDGFFFNYQNMFVGVDENNNIVSFINVVDKNTNFEYDYTEMENFSPNAKYTIEHYIKGLIEEVKGFEYAYISNVCVDEKLRGQGVGKGMLDYVINNIEKAKIKQIALDVLKYNPNALSLYEKSAKNNFRKSV